MPVHFQPSQYHTVVPFVYVPGVDKIIEFTKKVFDAVELHRMQIPNGPIMHAEVKIGDSIIMFAEPMGDGKPVPSMLYVYVPDVDAAYQKALDAGATSVAKPTDQFYGDRSAGVVDASGIYWGIGTHIEDVKPEEIIRREEAMRNKKG